MGHLFSFARGDTGRRIASQHQRTYFKRHPYASDDEKVVKQLLRSGSVELTDENIYRLLCHDNIQEVFSISSRVGYEAQFFGKKGTYLLPNPLKRYDPSVPDFDPETFVPIYDDFSPRLLVGTPAQPVCCPSLRGP